MNLGNALVTGAAVGGINYILTHVFTRINPAAGFICGAAVGFIGGIFPRPSWTHVALQVILAAGISTVATAAMGLPITFKGCLLLTALPVGVSLVCLLALGILRS